MKCEISLWKCKFKIILSITDYQRDFVHVLLFFALVDEQLNISKDGRFSQHALFFFSANCDGFRFVAAFFPAARVQQLFPQLFPHHISSRYTLPGFSSLAIASLLMKGLWMKSTPAVSPADNSATDEVVRVQTRVSQLLQVCFVLWCCFLVSPCSAAQMGFFHF